MVTIDFKTWVYSMVHCRKVYSPARKFIVSAEELRVIQDTVKLSEDTEFLERSIEKTLRPYVKKYSNEPDMPDGTLSFLLFEKEYQLLSEIIIEKEVLK